MEKLQEAAFVSRGSYHTYQINSCYDEFLRLRPDVTVLGEIFYLLLRDAVKSHIKSIAKSGDNIVLDQNVDNIVDLTERYTRIYFLMNKDDRSLLMLRSAIYDIIRGYDVNNHKYDVPVANLFESIRKLITV